jgi:hypothetical protein
MMSYHFGQKQAENSLIFPLLTYSNPYYILKYPRSSKSEKEQDMTEGQILQLVALVMVLGLVLPGFIYYSKRMTKGAILRNIAIWLALFVAAGLLYRIFG